MPRHIKKFTQIASAYRKRGHHIVLHLYKTTDLKLAYHSIQVENT